ncbi:hypothetical protein [Paraburkholderia sp. BCC1886]|uniref:hypothetical protein n=1 Tax=Paraburkholderia sp. BCC1886 TaxID=2562670 RepID=UPI00118455EA|nr:hypothetical protein [Paraburkholderia sp. BCC1886]
MTTLLENQRAVVALEAFALEDITGLLHRVFPAIHQGFRTLYDELISPNDQSVAPLTADQAKFLKLITGRNYISISPLPARVPEGLKVPFLVYGEALTTASNHAAKILDELSVFTLFLGKLINEHTYQYGTDYNPAFYSKMRIARVLDNKQLGACFQPGSTKAERTFGDVVGRNADWRSVFEVANLVSATIETVNRRTVLKKIEEAGQLLDVLEKKIARKELDGITPEMITSLSAGAYEMGEQLEMYSAVWYKVQAFVTAVNECTQVVNRAFDR